MKQAWLNGELLDIGATETIYEFVTRHIDNTEIPVLCHDPVLEPFGACRMCLVEVANDADSEGRLLAACHTPVQEGKYISTRTPRIKNVRSNILELMVANYPTDKIQPEAGEVASPFQKILAEHELASSRYPHCDEPGEVEKSHTYIYFDPAECIHCYRCIRACDEVQGQFVLGMANRGIKSHIIQGQAGSFSEAGCVACGRCVQTCPTNAISDRYRSKSIQHDSSVVTTCTYCGVGCQLEVKLEDAQILAISGVEDAEVNQGHTCVKGRYAFGFVYHPDRLTSPLIKKNGVHVEVSWDEALDYISSRLEKIIAEDGPDAIAGISSARCTNEENYLMQKFMRAVIGTNNIDGCARVCHAPTAYGMQQVYGTGAATNSIDEIPQADCILLIGANPTDAHPVTGARIKQAAIAGADLIIIDPREIELCKYARLHLQPRPGTNVALLNMICYYLIKHQLIDAKFIEQRTEGYAEFRASVLAQNLDELEELTGVSKSATEECALIYGQAENSMSFHGLGVTEHYQGSRTIMLIASMVMMTGNLGRPGTGVNPLRGQNNVQGAADMGVQPHQGPGYLEMSDPDVRQYYQQHWGVEVPGGPGLKIPEMFGCARGGKLKALWIMGEDIMQTDPNSCEVKLSLGMLDLLIVQELFMTETCEMADVVLPASSFLEKSGTFTNGERRVQRVNRVIEPLPGTRPDGQIMCDIMQKMGYPQGDYIAPEILAEISQVVPFFEGINWDNLKGNGKQWPVAADGSDTQILHQHSFKLPKGQFKHFDFQESPELEEHAGAAYPYILTTGRVLEHYNCGSMTRRTPNRELVERDVLLINPLDAHREGFEDNDFIELSSPKGTTHMHCKITTEMKPGILYTTFHYPEIAINHLTSGVFDQEAMTPEYKVVAVAVRQAALVIKYDEPLEPVADDNWENA